MNQSRFRLFVLGDPHICQHDMDLWQDAIEDIRAARPDGVLVLGDLTGSPEPGRPDVLAQAVDVLNQLGLPWRSIIGNHDLQWAGHTTDAQAVADFLHHVGRDTPWFRWDWPGLTILGLSNTVHRNGPVAQEIVLVDEQLAWLDGQLESLADRPVILAIHAPPIGSGVIHLAEHHAHTGNALVNQNHDASKVTRRLWRWPNVLMSFSGHNHMGQQYRDALSTRMGIHFAHTGVVGRHTRDGQRHSRVLDVCHDHFLIHTFDHVQRRIDTTLTYRSTHSLADWLTYRRNHHLKRMIPADPATMRQGPRGPIARDEVRFAVLNDSHLTAPAQPLQKRILQWANQQVIAHGSNHLLLNGDLSHHACARQVQALLHEMTASTVTCHLIPGNNEGAPLPAGLAFGDKLIACDALAQPLTAWPGLAWSLGVKSPQDLPQAIDALAAQLPATPTGTLLVVAHIAPKDLSHPMLDPLRQPGLQVVWISGHEHEPLTRQAGNIRVEIVAGLDPIKVRNTLPEIMLGVWDGQSLRLERRTMARHQLTPRRSAPHLVGLAYRGDPVDLLADAVEYDIPAVQFRSAQAGQASLFQDRLAAFHQRHPQGRLSIHLPSPSQSQDGPDMTLLAGPIAWAVEHGIDDWTIHLPAVPASKLYTADGGFQTTAWATACLARYVELARQAIAAGAQLSLENVNNNHPCGPEDELLSSRPNHVLSLIQHIRRAMMKEGLSADQARRVGMIFDTGHAFTDPVISKQHGLGDWLTRIGPEVQMAHVHQAGVLNGKIRRHTRIDQPATGRINHVGLMLAIQEYVSRPIVLLAEVRDRQDAIASAKTLQRILHKNALL